eukprot:EG_transcript_12163
MATRWGDAVPAPPTTGRRPLCVAVLGPAVVVCGVMLLLAGTSSPGLYAAPSSPHTAPVRPLPALRRAAAPAGPTRWAAAALPHAAGLPQSNKNALPATLPAPLAGGPLLPQVLAWLAGCAAVAVGAMALVGRATARRDEPALAMLAVGGWKAEEGAASAATPAIGAVGRRSSLGALAVLSSAMLQPPAALARPPRVNVENYNTTPEFQFRGAPHEGLKYYDLKAGSGRALKPGEEAKITLHFDCKYKSVVAVSSRAAVILAKNMTIERPVVLTYGALDRSLAGPEPTEKAVGTGVAVDSDPIVEGLFVVKLERNSPARTSGLQLFDRVLAVDGQAVEALGKDKVREALQGPEGRAVQLTVTRLGTAGELKVTVPKEEYDKLIVRRRKEDFVERAGGLYSGENLAPLPNLLLVPEALAGMQRGGVRTFVVPPELGYGPDGINEIPAGKDFTVDVELLAVDF